MWIGGFSVFGYCFERNNGILIFHETDIRFSQDNKNIQEPGPRTWKCRLTNIAILWDLSTVGNFCCSDHIKSCSLFAVYQLYFPHVLQIMMIIMICSVLCIKAVASYQSPSLGICRI